MTRLTLHPTERQPDRELTGPFVACGPGGCRTGYDTILVHTPTPAGAWLRAARLARREGLRDCAVRIGLTATELSGIESGRWDLPEGEWAEVERRAGNSPQEEESNAR